MADHLPTNASPASEYYSFVRRVFGVLPVLLLVIFYLLVSATPGKTADTTSHSFYAVSNYQQSNFDRNGRNHYYGMSRAPGSKQVLTVGGGYQDLLLYGRSRFRVQVLSDRVYNYGVDWHPEGSYALMAGSRLPPKSSGLIYRYTGIDTGLEVLRKVPANLTDVDFNEEGTALIVGGQLSPKPKSVVLKYKDGQFERISSPDSVPLKSVDWRPGTNEALLIGPRGVVLHYNGDTLRRIRTPARDALLSVAWSPDGREALIGGQNGQLYRWVNDHLMELTTTHEWSVHDIAWHPSGRKALLAGGVRNGDTGYWGFYRDLTVDSHRVSTPLFSAEWIDNNNALAGGQKALWRYSSTTDPEKLKPKASISVKRRTTRTGKPVVVSGFGSTHMGSVNRVDQYQFQFDQDPRVDWQKRPGMRVTFQQPGQHTVSLRVKGEDGQISSWEHRSLQLLPGEGQQSNTVYWYWSEIVLMVLVMLVGLFLIYWLFIDEIREFLR